jgi:hypothetical protein
LLYYICSKFSIIESKKLHIVSFDIPFPADYGGVIDVFYKIKSLYEQGVKIILHCYTYGRDEAPILEEFCEKVYYYKRNLSPYLLLKKTPFVVDSRNSQLLLERIAKDDYPVFFEGLHTCKLLDNKQIEKKAKFVRTHNIEHDYYKLLALAETKFSKRKYFKMEANKLQMFERILGKAKAIAAISKNDNLYFNAQGYNSFHISAFHSNNRIKCKSGKGNFVLYHGNLVVAENDVAAKFLIEKIFSKTEIPLVIAGNKPSKELILLAGKYKNVQLRDNISNEEIITLIKEAQINFLPTFQPTGIKLKLLAALFNGRFCMANSLMVSNTGLEKYCIVEDNPKLMLKNLENYFIKEFSEDELLFRQELESSEFSNSYNCKKLIDLIFKQ